jgi:hypothetical protein
MSSLQDRDFVVVFGWRAGNTLPPDRLFEMRRPELGRPQAMLGSRAGQLQRRNFKGMRLTRKSEISAATPAL